MPIHPSRFRSPHTGYKLAGSGAAMDVEMGDVAIDENEMSVAFPFADGRRRDGVGDLLEIGGISTERHRKNPVVLFDHGKQVVLPVAMAEDPFTKQYTVTLDPAAKVATVKAYFYQGKGDIAGQNADYEHSLFCHQLFDLIARKFVRGGSIGYQVIQARELNPDYERGTPKGLHLLQTLMLEASAVVMPANQDTVRKCLALPSVCGKPMSRHLIKSLTPFLTEKKAMVTGGFSLPVEAIKSVRTAYRVKANASWENTTGFEIGQMVTARSYLYRVNKTTRKTEHFASSGDRLRIVGQDGVRWKVERGDGETMYVLGATDIRKTKSLESSLKSIRMQYRMKSVDDEPAEVAESDVDEMAQLIADILTAVFAQGGEKALAWDSKAAKQKRNEGEVWQGQSGRWFTLKQGRTVPSKAPAGGNTGAAPAPTPAASKKPAAAKPKPVKVTPAEAKQTIDALRQSGPTEEALTELTATLSTLSMADIRAIANDVGAGKGRAKADLVAKIKNAIKGVTPEVKPAASVDDVVRAYGTAAKISDAEINALPAAMEGMSKSELARAAREIGSISVSPSDGADVLRNKIIQAIVERKSGTTVAGMADRTGPASSRRPVHSRIDPEEEERQDNERRPRAFPTRRTPAPTTPTESARSVARKPHSDPVVESVLSAYDRSAKLDDVQIAEIARTVQSMNGPQLTDAANIIGVQRKPNMGGNGIRDAIIARIRERRSGSMVAAMADKPAKDNKKHMTGTKSLAPASLKSIRMKYRKGMARRIKRGAPSQSMVYTSEKDLPRIREAAKAKGVGCQFMGTHKSGMEKVKLTGSDDAIDELSKTFGRHVKSLGGDMEPDVMGDVDTMSMDTAPQANEPHGASLLRRFHEDHSILMKDYHDALKLLEPDSGVRKHIEGALVAMEKALGQTEALFSKHYKDLPPLEGAMEVEDEIPDPDATDALAADSSPAGEPEEVMEEDIEIDEPTGDVEGKSGPSGVRVKGKYGKPSYPGIETYTGPDGYHETFSDNDRAKAEAAASDMRRRGLKVDVWKNVNEWMAQASEKFLPTAKRKNTEGDVEGKSGPSGVRVKGKYGKPSYPGIDAVNTPVGYIEKYKDKNKSKTESAASDMRRRGLQVNVWKDVTDEWIAEGRESGKSLPTAKRKNSDEMMDPAPDEKPEEPALEKSMKALEEAEKEDVREAVDFAKELSQVQALEDEQRHKSYHFHKSMTKVCGVKNATPGTEPADADGFQKSMEDVATTADMHPHRKACHEAGGYFGKIAKEKAFGATHREEAAVHAKAMEGALEGEPDTGHAEPDGDEGTMPEPGAMGEKALAEAKNKVTELQKKIKQLATQLATGARR